MPYLEALPTFSGAMHGYRHWQRVIYNGLYIADHTQGVDRDVVELFGLFHDTMRLCDGTDPYHGSRAAEYIESIHSQLYLRDSQLQKLLFAVENHTSLIHADDVTIGACFDSDRLDLPRVDIVPHPDYLNTDAAKAQATIMQEQNDAGIFCFDAYY